MELAEALFIVAIFICAAAALKDIDKRRINWIAAGLALFMAAIYLA